MEERLFVGIGEIGPVKVPGVAVPGHRGVVQKELSTGVGAILSNHGRYKTQVLPVVQVVPAAEFGRPLIRVVEQVAQGRDRAIVEIGGPQPDAV